MHSVVSPREVISSSNPIYIRAPGEAEPIINLPSEAENLSSYNQHLVIYIRRRKLFNMPLQVLDGRYIDLPRLVALLTNLFGTGNFEVAAEVRSSLQEPQVH
jgi:hypothetical protein